jgi:predicted TIM-barrel fold metal-dependent hydrolase
LKENRRIIDFSCHLLSKETIKIIQKKKFYGAGKGQYHIPKESLDPILRSKLMDKYGIGIQVLSFSAAALRGLSKDEASKVCQLANSSIFDFIQRNPERYSGLAVISLTDLDSALEELDRAIDQLGFRGVIVATNQEGRGLDDSFFQPFFARISKFDIPVLLHPTDWQEYPLVNRDIMTVFGWPFDTTQAVYRLILGGVLDRFPNLKIVTHHLGGMLPYFASRLEDHLKLTGREPKLKRKSIRKYWNNVYGDTAVDGNAASIACGLAFFGPDRVIYGTDYPFGTRAGETFIRSNLEGVQAMPVSDNIKSKILFDNSAKLLKLKI